MQNIRCEDDLRKLILGKLSNSRWHWQPVENIEVGAGTPDLNGCYVYGIEVWLELKVEPKLRKSQYIWMKKAARVGRNVWVAWWDNGNIYLIKGEDAVKYRLHETGIRDLWEDATHYVFCGIDWNNFAKEILYGQSSAQE